MAKIVHKKRLTSPQLELLKMLASCGWDEVMGSVVLRARGLARRKTPLVVLERDEEYEQKHGGMTYVARLTATGAQIVHELLGWTMREESDGSWVAIEAIEERAS